MSRFQAILEAAAADVQSWWDDNSTEVLADMVSQTTAVQGSVCKDAELLSIVEPGDEGVYNEQWSLEQFTEELSQKMIEGLLNVLKTSEPELVNEPLTADDLRQMHQECVWIQNAAGESFPALVYAPNQTTPWYEYGGGDKRFDFENTAVFRYRPK